MCKATEEIWVHGASGACAPATAQIYPLDALAEANEFQERGEAVGKGLVLLQNA